MVKKTQKSVEGNTGSISANKSKTKFKDRRTKRPTASRKKPKIKANSKNFLQKQLEQLKNCALRIAKNGKNGPLLTTTQTPHDFPSPRLCGVHPGGSINSILTSYPYDLNFWQEFDRAGSQDIAKNSKNLAQKQDNTPRDLNIDNCRGELRILLDYVKRSNQYSLSTAHTASYQLVTQDTTTQNNHRKKKNKGGSKQSRTGLTIHMPRY